MQGFPNSSGGGGGAEILLGEFFYQVVRTWGGVTLASDSKLKKACCEYWTSIKINISVTCVSKDYEIKTKVVQEQWLKVKMPFLLGYNLQMFI